MIVRLIFLVMLFCSHAAGMHANCSSAKNPKVVIVGTGLAGLTAATHLMENGFDNILILEAEERYGGRIFSVPFGDGFIDLGAQWVHGQEQNVIYEMLKKRYKFGLTGFDTQINTFVRSNGNSVDQRVCEDFYELSSQIMFASCNEMNTYNGSLGAFHKEKFFNIAAANKKKFGSDEFLVNEMIDYFEKEMNIWNGSSTWNDLSAKLHCSSGFNKGPTYQTFKRDGYKTFFKFLTKLDTPHQSIDIFKKIIYKQTVANIQWNQNYAIDSRRVILTCTDGHKYFADHVIFTPSLGVLKKHYLTLFSPQLPQPMIKAIKAMGFGTIGKIFLEFSEPFWPSEDWVGFGFLWTERDVEKLKGNKREWLLDLQAFTKVDAFPNLLEALLGGKHQATFENLGDDELIDDCMWMLEKFLKKSLPTPKSMHRTKWLTHKNFLGSYSYLSMDAMRNNITPANLAKTLTNLNGKPELLFAGEATDSLFSSNAHGAVNSGFRVTNELIEYYKKCWTYDEKNFKLIIT